MIHCTVRHNPAQRLPWEWLVDYPGGTSAGRATCRDSAWLAVECVLVSLWGVPK